MPRYPHFVRVPSSVSFPSACFYPEQHTGSPQDRVIPECRQTHRSAPSNCVSTNRGNGYMKSRAWPCEQCPRLSGRRRAEASIVPYSWRRGLKVCRSLCGLAYSLCGLSSVPKAAARSPLSNFYTFWEIIPRNRRTWPEWGRPPWNSPDPPVSKPHN
jgi:hypothetical protein